MWEKFPWTGDEVGLVKTSIGFTDFQWEIFGFLCHGKKLVIADDGVVRSPTDLVDLIERESVSHLVLV
jgi:non-ribosomal peptide synthetase component F